MFATAIRYCTRRPIHLIRTAEQSISVVERILSSGAQHVAVDCEGASLGRFGQLALIQLATDNELFLFDVTAGGNKVVQSLVPLLGSTEVTKVFHDCREDASILLHQYAAPLATVFDTQVGHATWLERKNLDLYQASAAEVLRAFHMGLYRAHRWDQLERRNLQPHRFHERPLDPAVVRYAVEGVAHLLPLQRSICKVLGDPSGDMVLRRSARYLDYAVLNQAEVPSSDLSVLRPGLALKAMLAVRREDVLYFKLNLSNITGTVADPVDIKDFTDLQPGDTAACRVKFVMDGKQLVHLQREGHGNLFYDYVRKEMRELPGTAGLDNRVSRQSSLYGFGQSLSSSPSIMQEPVSFKERKPDVIYKAGKRGNVKIRKTGTPGPAPKGRDDFTNLDKAMGSTSKTQSRRK